MFKIVFTVAFGLFFAGVVATAGTKWLNEILVDDVGNVIKPKPQVATTIQPNDLIPQNISPKTEQNVMQPQQQTAVTKLNGLVNTPKSRQEIIRENSEIAVIQARNETQSFDMQYAKPSECYNMKDSATRIKCANAYMTARAAFENKQR